MIGKICLRWTIALLLCALPFSASAAPEIGGAGELTSIEQDGSLLIDGKGYLVSGAVHVENGEGKAIPLRSLKVPAKVQFTYRYTSRGPVVLRVREGSVIPE